MIYAKLLIIFGLVIKYAPELVNWLGKMPGDIRIEYENKSVFIPITSSIVISIILSIIANRLFRKY